MQLTWSPAQKRDSTICRKYRTFRRRLTIFKFVNYIRTDTQTLDAKRRKQYEIKSGKLNIVASDLIKPCWLAIYETMMPVNNIHYNFVTS